MAAGDWYYQVWEHTGLEERVSVVATYKVESDANEKADMLNSKARYYSRDGCPPFRFFFVQPVLEEHLPEATAEHFRRCLSKDRAHFLSGYTGNMMKLARIMVPEMLPGIENCPSETRFRLSCHGGWHRCCCLQLGSLGYAKGYVLYSGADRVRLEIAIECGKRTCVCTVGIFESEEVLKEWLNHTPAAETAFEDALITLFCDRYRVLKSWLEGG